MNAKPTPFILFIASVLIMSSCNKQNDCVPPSLTVTSNGPVYVGDVLNLTASSDAGAVFSWTGPNSFSSTQQNPSIANVTAAASGDYAVTSKVGECEKTKTITVSVLDKPSCTPTNNTASHLTTMTFSTVSCGIFPSGKWEMHGTGLQGDINIQFYVNPVEKGNFVYDLSTMDANPNNAFIQIDNGGIYANWQATAGKLYVKLVNNKPSATFCSATFGNIQGASPRTSSGKLTCP
jgi:hypothetical protein